MDFAQRLKLLMESSGTTNYQLAKSINCHQTTIANILNGSKPQKRTKKAIAEHFGVSVSFLDGIENQSKGIIFDSSILSGFEINEEYFPEHIKSPTPEGVELSEANMELMLKNMSPAQLADLMGKVAKELKDRGLQ